MNYFVLLCRFKLSGLVCAGLFVLTAECEIDSLTKPALEFLVNYVQAYKHDFMLGGLPAFMAAEAACRDLNGLKLGCSVLVPDFETHLQELIKKTSDISSLDEKGIQSIVYLIAHTGVRLAAEKKSVDANALIHKVKGQSPPKQGQPGYTTYTFLDKPKSDVENTSEWMRHAAILLSSGLIYGAAHHPQTSPFFEQVHYLTRNQLVHGFLKALLQPGAGLTPKKTMAMDKGSGECGVGKEKSQAQDVELSALKKLRLVTMHRFAKEIQLQKNQFDTIIDEVEKKQGSSIKTESGTQEQDASRAVLYGMLETQKIVEGVLNCLSVGLKDYLSAQKLKSTITDWDNYTNDLAVKISNEEVNELDKKNRSKPEKLIDPSRSFMVVEKNLNESFSNLSQSQAYCKWTEEGLPELVRNIKSKNIQKWHTLHYLIEYVSISSFLLHEMATDENMGDLEDKLQKCGKKLGLNTQLVQKGYDLTTSFGRSLAHLGARFSSEKINSLRSSEVIKAEEKIVTDDDITAAVKEGFHKKFPTEAQFAIVPFIGSTENNTKPSVFKICLQDQAANYLAQLAAGTIVDQFLQTKCGEKVCDFFENPIVSFASNCAIKGFLTGGSMEMSLDDIANMLSNNGSEKKPESEIEIQRHKQDLRNHVRSEAVKISQDITKQLYRHYVQKT